MTETAKIGTPQELREHLRNSPTLLGVNEEVIQKRKKVIQKIICVLEYLGEDLNDFTFKDLDHDNLCRFVSEVRMQLSSILGDVVFGGNQSNRGLYVTALCADEHGEQDLEKQYLTKSANRRLGELGLAHKICMDNKKRPFIVWEKNFQESIIKKGPLKGQILFKAPIHQDIFKTLLEKRVSGKYRIWGSAELQALLTGETIYVQIGVEIRKMQRYLSYMHSKYQIGQIGRGLYILLEGRDITEIEQTVQYEISLRIKTMDSLIKKNQDLTLREGAYFFRDVELQGDEFYFLCLIILSTNTTIGMINKKHPISKTERCLLIRDINEKIKSTGLCIEKRGKKYSLSETQQVEMFLEQGNGDPRVTLPIFPWEIRNIS